LLRSSVPLLALLSLAACATPEEIRRSTLCEEITGSRDDYNACLNGDYPVGRKSHVAAREAGDDSASESSPRRKPKPRIRKLAVLPFDARAAKSRLNATTRTMLEDVVRVVATDALGPGWEILSSADTMAGFADTSASQCLLLKCLMEAARELQADAVVIGTVEWHAPKLVLDLGVMDVSSGDVLSSGQVDGRNADGLRKALEIKANELFVDSGLRESKSPESAPAPRPPAPKEESPSTDTSEPAPAGKAVPAAEKTEPPAEEKTGPPATATRRVPVHTVGVGDSPPSE
jgi:TolB-like protein